MTAVAAPAYADNNELLKALAGIGAALMERAQAVRQALAASQSEGAPTDLLRGRVDQVVAWLDQEWELFDRRARATVAAGRFIPWLHLGALFQLDRGEQALLLLALLPELDGHAAALYAAEAGQKGTGGDVPLGAAARMLGLGRGALRQALNEDGVLLDWHLLELAPGTDVSAGRGAFHLAAGLAPYLLGQALPRPRWEEPLAEIPAETPLESMALDECVAARADALVKRWTEGGETIGTDMLLVQSPDQTAAEALCAALLATQGMTCVRLEARAIRRDRDPASVRQRLRLLCRDALLTNRVPVLTDAQWLVTETDDSLLADTVTALVSCLRHVAVVNGPSWRLADLAHRHRAHVVVPLRLTLPPPDAALRRRLWRLHGGRAGVALSEATLERLVTAYQFTETQIACALKDTAARQLLDGDPEAALVAACRAQAEREPMALADQVRTGFRLADVILPDTTAEAVREVLLHVRHRDTVMEGWGFGAATGEGRNLCVLFHGPSGTGKTMAASALANELGLGLYKIDLSSVLSKYVGETEQRLAQLFDQAEAMNIVLFFDEAESLFGKRTEAHDANDRHANLQTGYLLQRIETYPGIVVLSTNLLHNLDPAFTRRFQFIIEYAFPGEDERLALWRAAFPAQAPLGRDLDVPLLAEKTVLTGGHIRAAAIAAALYAAAEGAPVGMEHVLRGVRREYDKLGKVFFARDFQRPEED